MTAVQDALGNFTRYAYDVRGQQIAIFGNSTYPIRFEYNDFGEKTAHYTFREPSSPIADTDEPLAAQGDRTRYTYDPTSGLLIAKTFADHNATHYTYDINGNLTTRLWARGIATRYTYDSFGQLTLTDYADTITTDISMVYTPMGQLDSVTDAKGTTLFSYNDF